MPEHETKELTPDHRRRAALVFGLSGLADIGLGLAVAIFGPSLLQLDGFTSILLGSGLAVAGVLVWAFGRWRYGPVSEGRRLRATVTRNR